MADTLPLSLLDRLYALRDRLVGDPTFQRWAAAFPLTRPIARRQAAQLFDLVAGFVYSQVLLACVRLRVFDILAEGPQSVTTLAHRLDLSEDTARRLLAAAVPLGLLAQRADGRYALGQLGAVMVGNRAVSALVEHHAAVYLDLADPVALLRRDAPTRLSGYWAYAGDEGSSRARALSAEQVAEYSALMSASQPLVADQIIDAYDLGRHRCLLDIGGGEGTFLSQVARRVPRLQLRLFDLPAVAERARHRFAAQGIGHRAEAHGGSFFDDALPTGADIVSLVRVIYDHDDAHALRILRAARRALPPDGTLLLAEPMAGTPGAEAMGDAYFGFYLLAMGKGEARTPDRLGALLREAGFERIRILPTHLPLQTRVIVARP
jgi:demethylspheroidene O-methyltransferase